MASLKKCVFMTMGLIAVVDVVFFCLVTVLFNAAMRSIGTTFSGEWFGVTEILENRYATAMIPLGVAAIVCHIAVIVWMTHFLVTKVQPVLEKARQQNVMNKEIQTQMTGVSNQMTNAAGLMKKSVKCLYRLLGEKNNANNPNQQEKQDSFKHS